MFETRTVCVRPLGSQQGFTLIEVLVSLSLFTIVATMSVGTLLVLVNGNVKAENQQVVSTNLSFALDAMARDIRTGTYYEVNPSNADLNNNKTKTKDGIGSSFGFTESGGSLTKASGGRIGYRLNTSTHQIERSLPNASGQGGNWQPFTSDDVTVDQLQFVVSGSTPGDAYTPAVTIFIEATIPGTDGTTATTTLETTLVQESLDL